jgi:hypothetical protein
MGGGLDNSSGGEALRFSDSPNCAHERNHFGPSSVPCFHLPDGAAVMVDNTFEKHYRIGDLSRMWGLGRETVRKLVKDDLGVIKIRMGRKKAHTVYSIPESAARRIHTRLLNVA